MRQTPFDDSKPPLVLTVPGLGSSGPSHWQTLWEESRLDTARVELGMWQGPHRNGWVSKLDQTIRSVGQPTVLAAHSLGVLAVAWWAELADPAITKRVVGALLVAPPDVDRPDARAELHSFRPAPQRPLPFPSILVASSDDPWITIDRAAALATSWGSHFVDAGAQGHLNADSRLGWWAEGQTMLERVIAIGTPRRRRPGARAVVAINATDAAQSHYLGEG